jgi:hypothetical protein
MGADRESDADMHMFTSSLWKHEAECWVSNKQDQKKWVFFAALQHTRNNMQKSTNKVNEMKKN